MKKTGQVKFKIPKKILKYLAILVAALIFIAYIITATKFTLNDFGIIIAFILIGAIARFPQRFAPIALGIELISLFTIVSAIKYGSLAGAIVGVSSFIISGYFTVERPQDVIIAVLGFAGVAYFAPIAYLFFGQNLGFVAIALTVGYDFFTGIFYMLFGYNLVSVLRFSAVHIIANFFIISYLGMKLLGT